MKLFSHILLVLIVIFASSCSDKSTVRDDSQVLVRIGDTALMRDELKKAMPGGLTPADSAHYASAFIKKWIDAHLISDIASDEIDMSDINRLVDEYRSRLIEMEYKRQMFNTHAALEYPEDTLRSYYESHKADFVIERPMLKGIYLKVPDDARNLAVIKKLYRSDKEADIDRLEKEVLTSAIHYDYFRDNWVDWEQIELHIPYDFSGSPDTFLKGRKFFEETAGGFVYLLDIKEVLSTGSLMPYENARQLIVDRLNAKSRKDYEATLVATLYEKSLKDGKIQLFVDIER